MGRGAHAAWPKDDSLLDPTSRPDMAWTDVCTPPRSGSQKLREKWARFGSPLRSVLAFCALQGSLALAVGSCANRHCEPLTRHTHDTSTTPHSLASCTRLTPSIVPALRSSVSPVAYTWWMMCIVYTKSERSVDSGQQVRWSQVSGQCSVEALLRASSECYHTGQNELEHTEHTAGADE